MIKLLFAIKNRGVDIDLIYNQDVADDDNNDEESEMGNQNILNSEYFWNEEPDFNKKTTKTKNKAHSYSMDDC